MKKVNMTIDNAIVYLMNSFDDDDCDDYDILSEVRSKVHHDIDLETEHEEYWLQKAKEIQSQYNRGVTPLI